MRKVAVITGGAKGIGFGITKKLAKDGFAAVIFGTSPEGENPELTDWMKKEKVPYLYVQGSLDDREARERLVSQAVQRFGRIDVLVNNAGVAPLVRSHVLEMTEESYDRVMGINLKGTVFLSQLAANQMRSQEAVDGCRGIIVNIGSMSATVVSVSRGEYCMSKAGISMWTKLLAAAVADDHIFVYEVQPGIIQTRLTAPVKGKYDAVCASDELLVKRWGQPEDIAEAVSVFCTGKLSYCTGQILASDGGFGMRRL